MPTKVDILPGLHRIDVSAGKKAPQFLGGAESHRASRILGFSQTREWILSGLDNYVETARWEHQTPNGASIEKWADPNNEVWTSTVASPVAEPPITRVVLNVSGAARTQAQWQTDIESAVATVRNKLPDVTTIILVPVVGGPGHTVCQVGGQDVRAAANHPTIDLAIADVVAADPTVTQGNSPEVGVCEHYEDTTGHLTSGGASHVCTEVMGPYLAGLD